MVITDCQAARSSRSPARPPARPNGTIAHATLRGFAPGNATTDLVGHLSTRVRASLPLQTYIYYVANDRGG